MDRRRSGFGWLGLAAGVCSLAFGVAVGRAGWNDADASGAEVGPVQPAPAHSWFFSRNAVDQHEAAAHVPLDRLPAGVRDSVQLVLEKPTLFTHGPREAFTCSPSMYQWLLEHPDRGVQVWRRLGAQCMEIENRGSGVFGWSDGQGSDVRWWTVLRSPDMRIWYAEGSVRAAGLLPLVPVRAVVVLYHAVGRSAAGRPLVRHHADLFLHTDSKTAALVTRMMGPSAPRMAEQCAGQVELFFSALAWYLDQHPARAGAALLGILPPGAPQWHDLKERAQAPRSSDRGMHSALPNTGT